MKKETEVHQQQLQKVEKLLQDWKFEGFGENIKNFGSKHVNYKRTYDKHMSARKMHNAQCTTLFSIERRMELRTNNHRITNQKEQQQAIFLQLDVFPVG